MENQSGKQTDGGDAQQQSVFEVAEASAPAAAGSESLSCSENNAAESGFRLRVKMPPPFANPWTMTSVGDRTVSPVPSMETEWT